MITFNRLILTRHVFFFSSIKATMCYKLIARLLTMYIEIVFEQPCSYKLIVHNIFASVWQWTRIILTTFTWEAEGALPEPFLMTSTAFLSDCCLESRRSTSRTFSDDLSAFLSDSWLGSVKSTASSKLLLTTFTSALPTFLPTDHPLLFALYYTALYVICEMGRAPILRKDLQIGEPMSNDVWCGTQGQGQTSWTSWRSHA